jgi:hypothetical protein
MSRRADLDIPAGCQHFDGRTALAYVRTRHQPCDTVPDFARISRQQQFLRAVIAKVLQPGELLRLQQLVPELLGNLVVDEGMNPAELVYLAGLLQGVGTDNADFRPCRLPEGIYDRATCVDRPRCSRTPTTNAGSRGKPLGDLGQSSRRRRRRRPTSRSRSSTVTAARSPQTCSTS